MYPGIILGFPVAIINTKQLSFQLSCTFHTMSSGSCQEVILTLM